MFTKTPLINDKAKGEDYDHALGSVRMEDNDETRKAMPWNFSSEHVSPQ